MINSFQATVTDTAALLVSASGVSGDIPRIVHLSTASGALYLGGSSAVDSTDGFPFDDSSAPMTVVLQPGDNLYAVSGGSVTVQVMVTRADALTPS